MWLKNVSAFLLWLSHVDPPHLPPPISWFSTSHEFIHPFNIIRIHRSLSTTRFSKHSCDSFLGTMCAARCIRGAFAVHLRCICGTLSVHHRCICCAFVLQLRYVSQSSIMQCGAFVADFFINTMKTEQKTRNQATQKKIKTLSPSSDYLNITTSTQNKVKYGTTRQHPPSSESNEKRNGWPTYHGMRTASNPTASCNKWTLGNYIPSRFQRLAR